MNTLSPPPPTAVLFDLDGTLVDSEEIHFQLYRNVARLFHLNLTSSAYEAYFKGKTDEQVVAALALRSSLNYTPEELQLYIQRKRVEYRNHLSAIREIPGATKYLRSLRLQSLPIAVVTSATTDEAQLVLRQTRLDRFIDLVLSIPSHGYQPKPSPEAYLKAAERLENEPAACLVYEDSIAGIQAATAASMNVIAVRQHPTRHVQNAGGALLSIATFQRHRLRDVQRILGQSMPGT